MPAAHDLGNRRSRVDSETADRRHWFRGLGPSCRPSTLIVGRLPQQQQDRCSAPGAMPQTERRVSGCRCGLTSVAACIARPLPRHATPKRNQPRPPRAPCTWAIFAVSAASDIFRPPSDVNNHPKPGDKNKSLQAVVRQLWALTAWGSLALFECWRAELDSTTRH